MKKLASFNVSFRFRSQLTEHEIFKITNIHPTSFGMKGDENIAGRVMDDSVWDKITKPSSDDINIELEKLLDAYSKFLPNKLFHEVRLTIMFDPTMNVFFPKILRGK